MQKIYNTMMGIRFYFFLGGGEKKKKLSRYGLIGMM